MPTKCIGFCMKSSIHQFGKRWSESNLRVFRKWLVHIKWLRILPAKIRNRVEWKEFLIINLINVITPNGDGYNDVLDYSDLSIKNEVDIKIFDRYGKMIHENHGDNFTWDWTSSGRVVSTGSYWYLLKWKEPDTGKIVSYTGWLLVKNRN